MAKSTSEYGQDISIGPVRLDFVYFAEKDTGNKNSRNKYKVTILVPKKDKKTLGEIEEALCNVAGVENLDDIGSHPFLDKYYDFRDGDKKDREGYAGHVFFNTTSNNPIDCYIRDEMTGRPVLLKTKEDIVDNFYNGVYALVTLTPAYHPDHDVASFFITAALKFKDGAKLSGGRPTDTKQGFMSKMAEMGIKMNPEDEEEEQEEQKVHTNAKMKKQKEEKIEIEEEEEEEQEVEIEEAKEEEVIKPKKRRTKKKASLSDVLNS